MRPRQPRPATHPMRSTAICAACLFGLATAGLGQTPPRIDATSSESFQASLKAMKAGMGRAEASEFDRVIANYLIMIQPRYLPRYLEKSRASGGNRAGLEQKDLLAMTHELEATLHGLTAAEVRQKAVEAAQENRKRLEEMRARQAAAAAKRPTIAPPEDEGVERAWAVEGPYEAVTAGPGGRPIFAVRKQGRCDVLDAGGTIARSIDLEGFEPSPLPLARLGVRAARAARGGEVLVTTVATNYPLVVLASRGDGTRIWSGRDLPGMDKVGVDEVIAADIDGDGVDEVIAGGTAGLQVFSAEGKPLWRRPEANGGAVAAGHLNGDGTPVIAATSAPQGRVHLFAAKDGSPLRTIDPGLYVTGMRAAPGTAIGLARGDVLLVTGRSRDAGLAALGGDGETHRSLKLSETFDPSESLSVSPDGRWAAATLRSRRIRIVDVGRGRVVGQVIGRGGKSSVAWAVRPEETTPLLLVADGRGLTAFRPRPADSPPVAGPKPTAGPGKP